MFKMRVQNPNKPKAVLKEKANINYIATRPGVVLNEGCEHGLFGRIEKKQQQETLNLKEAKGLIGERMKEKKVIHRCVLSLREEDALQLGIDTPEKWQELTESNVKLIAEGLGIKESDLEYVAAIHMEKGHPHVHISLWDKSSRVQEPFVHKNKIKDIRKNLNHNVYKELLSEWYHEKSLSRDEMIKMQKELIQNIPNEKKDINGRFPNMRQFDTALYEEVSDAMDEFKERLPPTGRITYKTLPPEQKEQLNKIIDKIVDTNEDFSEEMKRYLFYSEKIGELGGKKQKEESVNRAKQDIYNRLGNVILNAVKDELKKEKQSAYEAKRDEQIKAYRMQTVQRLLFDMFRLLSIETSYKNKNYIDRKQELSKDARRELAKKYENTSRMNWDR